MKLQQNKHHEEASLLLNGKVSSKENHHRMSRSSILQLPKGHFGTLGKAAAALEGAEQNCFSQDRNLPSPARQAAARGSFLFQQNHAMTIPAIYLTAHTPALIQHFASRLH